MNRTQFAWLLGRPFFRVVVRALAPMRVYGRDRIPLNGPLVLCFNHFSWLDPWALGSVVPRTVYYVAKQEAHDNPLVGPFIRLFGTSSVRRGESDREAIRIMREVVRRGDTLGMFPEGTRQKHEPGPLRAGAAPWPAGPRPFRRRPRRSTPARRPSSRPRRRRSPRRHRRLRRRRPRRPSRRRRCRGASQRWRPARGLRRGC